MQQLVLPEIQAVIENLNASITNAEQEIEHLVQERKAKKAQVRQWKQAIAKLNGTGRNRKEK